MGGLTQRNRGLKVQSPLPEDHLLLQSVRGEEELSRPFEYNLELLSSDSDLTGDRLVGNPLAVEYVTRLGQRRVIHGVVSQFAYTGETAHQNPADRVARYSAKIVPWLWLLDSNRNCRIFQRLSTPSIIQQVFQELGFRDFEISLTENYPLREFCVQYQESDFNFVSRLMEEEGIYYYFRHEIGRHTLCLRDSVAGYFDLPDNEVKMGVDQTSEFQLSHWLHRSEFRPGKMAQGDFNFLRPSDSGMRQSQQGSVPYQHANKFEVFEYPGRYPDSELGRRLTRVRMQALECRHDVVEGAGTYPSFTPGGKFRVVAHPRESARQAHVITRVGLVFNNNFGGGAAPNFSGTFQCIPASTIFRPERQAVRPRIDGVQTAVVTTDGRKEEIVVDEHGRVKVQFHWDREGKNDFQSSCWIRVSQTHAGKGWGTMDIPRQNEEVIVAFVDGDPDRPMIIGRVYNGENPVPFRMNTGSENFKHKTLTGHVTKTYKGRGHNGLVMDDTPGKEVIVISQRHSEGRR